MSAHAHIYNTRERLNKVKDDLDMNGEIGNER